MTDSKIAAADLSICDQEPIHVPGSIQPHGALLALAPGTLHIEQVAGDTSGLLGIAADDLLGQPIEILLNAAQVARLQDTLQTQRKLNRSLPAFELVLHNGARRVDAIVHESDGIAVLEFEPPGDEGHDNTLALLHTMEQRLRKARTVPDLCQGMAEAVRETTGFDRVMVYRFLPDGSGQVDAEALAPEIEGFLGLRFPASDIPRQARALYLRNWLRLIPNARYTPAPLQPELAPSTGRPLDLSQSVLRSVSPIHLEYLANMDVAASMSISLVQGGTLWGLIACHHRTPLFVPTRLRVACELFAEMASLRLETQESTQELEGKLAARQVLETLMLGLANEPDLASGLQRLRPKLLELISGSAVVLWFNGQHTSLGPAPRAAEIAGLVDWLGGREEGIFATDHLAALYPPAAAFAYLGSGLLAMSLSQQQQAGPLQDYVLWFLPEQTQSVTWAGNPEKAVQAGEQGMRMSPRGSFAAWQQEVHQHSRPWRQGEIGTANSLRMTLLEVVLRRIDLVSSEQAAARRRENFLMAKLDHRVKNMLATIQALVGQSQVSESKLAGFLATFEGRLQAMSRAHSLLTKNRWDGVNLLALINAEMAPYHEGAPSPVMIAACPAVLMRPKAALALSLGLHELATNAAQYGALSQAGGQVHIEWHTAQRPGGPMLLLNWRETGGPVVIEPPTQGFGLTLIESSLSYELGGTMQFRFLAEGMACTVEIPWDQVASAAELPRPTAAPRPTHAMHGLRAPTALAPVSSELSGARILLVEDNALLANSVVRSLKLWGAVPVGPASRLEAAIELSSTATFDVAILDIDLDGTAVWPAADALVARGIPFLLASGYEASLVVPPSLLGCPVLNKPFTLLELRTALERLLAGAPDADRH